MLNRHIRLQRSGGQGSPERRMQTRQKTRPDEVIHPLPPQAPPIYTGSSLQTGILMTLPGQVRRCWLNGPSSTNLHFTCNMSMPEEQIAYYLWARSRDHPAPKNALLVRANDWFLASPQEFVLEIRNLKMVFNIRHLSNVRPPRLPLERPIWQARLVCNDRIWNLLYTSKAEENQPSLYTFFAVETRNQREFRQAIPIHCGEQNNNLRYYAQPVTL